MPIKKIKNAKIQELPQRVAQKILNSTTTAQRHLDHTSFPRGYPPSHRHCEQVARLAW
ncbi:hypothetical protein [Helicobacter sp. T3_23-1056]